MCAPCTRGRRSCPQRASARFSRSGIPLTRVSEHDEEPARGWSPAASRSPRTARRRRHRSHEDLAEIVRMPRPRPHPALDEPALVRRSSRRRHGLLRVGDDFEDESSEPDDGPYRSCWQRGEAISLVCADEVQLLSAGESPDPQDPAASRRAGFCARAPVPVTDASGQIRKSRRNRKSRRRVLHARRRSLCGDVAVARYGHAAAQKQRGCCHCRPVKVRRGCLRQHMAAPSAMLARLPLTGYRHSR